MLHMSEAEITPEAIDVLGGCQDLMGSSTSFEEILRNPKLQGAAKQLAQNANMFRHAVLSGLVACHNDIHRRNLMLRTPDDLVVIDFEFGCVQAPHIDLRWILAQPPRFEELWLEVDFLAIPILSEAGRRAFALGYLQGFQGKTPDEADCEALLFDIELT